jgi:hypothetical protein
MHADDLTPMPAIHALGQGRPAFDKPIGIGELIRLGVLRRLGVRSRCEACNKERAGNKCRYGSSRIRHGETSLQSAIWFGSGRIEISVHVGAVANHWQWLLRLRRDRPRGPRNETAPVHERLPELGTARHIVKQAVLHHSKKGPTDGR